MEGVHYRWLLGAMSLWNRVVRLKLVLMGKDSLGFVDNTTVLKIGFCLFLKKGLAIQLSHGLGFQNVVRIGTVLRLA